MFDSTHCLNMDTTYTWSWCPWIWARAVFYRKCRISDRHSYWSFHCRQLSNPAPWGRRRWPQVRADKSSGQQFRHLTDVILLMTPPTLLLLASGIHSAYWGSLFKLLFVLSHYLLGMTDRFTKGVSLAYSLLTDDTDIGTSPNLWALWQTARTLHFWWSCHCHQEFE